MYNESLTDPLEKIDGIHFDIEPHKFQVEDGSCWVGKNGHKASSIINDTYHVDDNYNDDYERRLLEILSYCKETIRDKDLTLAIDLGADYYHYVSELWQPILRNNLVDYISIMNYYDAGNNSNNENSFLYGAKDDSQNIVGGGSITI